MHFITILKSSGEIVDYRIDMSAPKYWTTTSLKDLVGADHKISEDSLETLEFDVLPSVKDGEIIESLTPNMHAYDAVSGKLKNNPAYVAPPVARRWAIGMIVPQLTLAEKTKFINQTTPTVVTAILELTKPRNQADTIEILQFLVDSGDISQASMTKILA